MKHLTFLLVTLFVWAKASSQTPVSDHVIGKEYILESNILNQKREFKVYLPPSYEKSDQRYPVLYILDGQWYFENGVAIQKSLRTPRTLPEMIVVGISNKNPLRLTLFYEDKEKFTGFLEKELISFIDSKFRTTKERVLFGWENAAFYASDLVLSKKQLFSGAIVTNGGNVAEKVIDQFQSNSNIYLYIANSRRDIYTISETEAFVKKLQKEQLVNLSWKYELFNDENHRSLPHLAMYKGLRYYYHNYESLGFESIQEYVDLGGIPYLESFFKERAARFGGDPKIDNGAKDGLIWLAWKRNNFNYFSFFMKEFKEVLSTKRYASAYWQNRFGQFYLKHKDYTNAIKYFEQGLSKYPNPEFNAIMKKGLNDAKSGQLD